MKRILFFAGNSDAQLASYIPVMQALRRQENLTLSVFYTEEFPESSQSGNSELLAATKDLVDEFLEYSGGARVRPSRIRANSWWNSGRALCAEIANVLTDLNPALVVTPNNEAFRNRVASKLAALSEIPVLVLLDGAIPGGLRSRLKCFPLDFRVKYAVHSLARFMLTSIGLLGVSGPAAVLRHNIGHCSVTKMAVWGNRTRDVALAHGFTESQIEVIGQPKFDPIKVRDWSEESTSLYRQLGSQDSAKRIVFLPTKGIGSSFFMTRQENIEVYRSLMRTVNELNERGPSEVTLIIKLHRNEHMAEFRAVAPASVLEHAILVQDVALYPLLFGCDAVVTTASGAGLEALLFDNPLVTLNFSGRPDFRSYARSGAALGVSDPPGLNAAIAQILDDPNCRRRLAEKRAKFVASQVSDMDGHSSDRACELIMSMVQATNTEPRQKPRNRH